MFKSEEHKVGYQNLRADYEVMSAAFSKVQTRLAEKTIDGLNERFWDEVMDCFEEKFLTRAQVWMEKTGNDGDLDGFFVSVDFFISWEKYPPYLVEAYKGYYENEMASDLTFPMEEPEDEELWVMAKIFGHNPREQLNVYLEWNGIIGYMGHILNILIDFPSTQN